MYCTDTVDFDYVIVLFIDFWKFKYLFFVFADFEEKELKITEKEKMSSKLTLHHWALQPPTRILGTS